MALAFLLERLFRSGFLQHLQTLFTEGCSVFDQVDDVLDLKEDLEAVEPHHLVRTSVCRKHKRSLTANEIEQVSQIRLLGLFHLDRLGSLRILKVTGDNVFHLHGRKLFLRRLGIPERHCIHVHDTESHLEGRREEHGALLA